MSTLLGYRRHFGNKLVHVDAVFAIGPGAVSFRALCDRVQPRTMLTRERPMRWWEGGARYGMNYSTPTGPVAERKDACPYCREIAEKREAAA